MPALQYDRAERAMRIFGACLLLAMPARAHAEKDVALELESYCAHLAAAEKAIRLGEGPEARRWLDAAPEALRGWEWAHLDAVLDESLAAFRTPMKDITAFAVAEDEKLAAGADSEGRVHVWKLPEFTHLNTIQGHTDTVYSVAFGPRGERLVSVSRDVTARVWNRKDGKEIARIALDNPGVGAAAFSPDGKSVATCSWTRKGAGANVRGVVWIWSAESGEVAARTLVGIKPLDSIQYSPDGNRIVVGSWDGIVHVLDAAGKEVRALPLPEEDIYNAVQAVDVSPDGRWLAAASKDRTARVWNVESGKLRSTLRGHGGFVTSVAFSPDGQRLLTGSVDASLRLWNWKDERQRAILHGHQRSIKDAVWQSERIYSSSRDGTIRVWDPDAQYGGRLAVDTGIDGIYTAAFTPNGSQIAIAAYNGHVILVDAHSGATRADWVAHDGSSCNALAISGDGRFILTCSWDKTAKLWDLKTQALIRTFDAADGIRHCDISKDGRTIALAVGPHVQVWDARQGKRKASLQAHTDTVRQVSFNHAGALIASVSSDKTLRLWDVATGAQKLVISTHGAPLGCVAFGSDDRVLAVGDDAGAVRLFDAASGELRHVLFEGDSRINHVAFTPDGSRVAVADQAVRILDARGGGQLLWIQPHEDTVWHLSFSPDGQRLATCSWNGTLVVSESLPLARRTARVASD